MSSYLIAAHTDRWHLARLCSRLSPDGRIYVHVDAKVQGDSFDAFKTAVASVRPAARFIEPRRRVTWSGFESMAAQLDLVRAALEETDPEEHLVLLSGSDYPIRPVADFEDFLRSADHRQHIRGFAIEEGAERHRRQIDRYWWMDKIVPGRRADKILRRVLNDSLGPALGRRRKPPHVVCQGLTWWAITARCARHVLEELERDPAIERYYRHVWCPDEKLVHSIVLASPYAEETKHRGREPFRGEGQWRLTNFHLIHPTLTKYYTLDDLPEIEKSEQFFVRKVKTGISTSLLEWIDRERLRLK
jgi:Core-2/I-Branching enzyme